jgi:hypothetical protein
MIIEMIQHTYSYSTNKGKLLKLVFSQTEYYLCFSDMKLNIKYTISIDMRTT